MRTFLFVMLVACGGGTKSAPPPVSNEAPPPTATVDQTALPADADSPTRCEDAKSSEMAKCAVATMEHYTNKMCSCTDKTCANGVNEGLTKWGTNMAKTAGAHKDEKPDPDLAKKSADIMTRYTECMTKLLMGAEPPSDPCGGGDNPCG